MGIPFNADEMFEMAERIERNGATFYRAAAETVSEASLRRRLVELAAWEDEHEKIFAAMRAQLTPEERTPTVFDPDDQRGLYLEAMADRRVFDVNTDPGELPTGKETLVEILQAALQREKDSVVFYTGMQGYVPQRLGKDRIEGLIREEMGHIALLGKELRALKA
jgi:rubrerythrin